MNTEDQAFEEWWAKYSRSLGGYFEKSLAKQIALAAWRERAKWEKA